MITIPAIIVGAHLTVAVADRLPVLNFEETCREATSGARRTNDKLEACIADEKRARDQLAGKWSSLDPAARTRCSRASTSGYAASYLELLICLELDQADREVHGPGSTTGITITEPERPVGERDQLTVPNQGRPASNVTPSRPAPAAFPSQPAPAAAPSQHAPTPRPLQPVARSAVAPPATPPSATPLPISPPVLAPQPPSQADLLQQSFCRSPLGYVLPGCR
jgi:hypothetical protein